VRIAIDARKLHDFGIGTYVRNLLREFARQPYDDQFLVLCHPADRDEIGGFGPKLTPVIEEAANYSARELLSVPTVLRRLRAELFHAPHYVVSPLTPRPYVVTIHDCIHLRFPQYLPHRRAHLYARAMMRLAAKRSHRIITVSEASRRDIVELLGVSTDKIEVIPNAIDERLAAPHTEDEIARVRERFQLQDPFVLYAGNIKPHKNIDRLIEAFSLFKQRQPGETRLVIIGDETSRYPNLRRLVHRHQLHKFVRFLGFVSDDQLAALYRLASVFVFPSLYEGFGLPPLEALALGTPVVTSNVSSLPEVVGDAALLIDPLDAGAIADAIARVLSDPVLRDDIVRRGRQRVQEFSWARSAELTREVYAGVLAAVRHG